MHTVFLHPLISPGKKNRWRRKEQLKGEDGKLGKKKKHVTQPVHSGMPSHPIQTMHRRTSSRANFKTAQIKNKRKLNVQTSRFPN
jgi:hypothetical protein